MLGAMTGAPVDATAGRLVDGPADQRAGRRAGARVDPLGHPLGNPLADRLAGLFAGHYSTAEMPALVAQARLWARTRPLSGLAVLDGSPMFRNTLTKYWALACGGADLTVSSRPGIPGDGAVLAELAAIGVRVADEGALAETYDVVLDCAGLHAGVASRHGYAELTRTGLHCYLDCPQPVLLADAGRVKLIETLLGTGDGFVRALAELGHVDLRERGVLIFGAGKVGTGVAVRCRAAGARVSVVDDPRSVSAPDGCRMVDLADRPSIVSAIARAWCVVSATGRRDALAGFALELAGSPALIANMGVEDEFGPALPEDRVLNAKAPLNFILAEPTRLRYLDPTFAVHNAAVTELLAGRLRAGVNLPSAQLEEPILELVRDAGLITGELAGVAALRPGGGPAGG